MNGRDRTVGWRERERGERGGGERERESVCGGKKQEYHIIFGDD